MYLIVEKLDFIIVLPMILSIFFASPFYIFLKIKSKSIFTVASFHSLFLTTISFGYLFFKLNPVSQISMNFSSLILWVLIDIYLFYKKDKLKLN